MSGFGALSSYPLGASAAGEVSLCSDSIEFHALSTGIAATPLHDGLMFGDTSTTSLVSVLKERLALTGSVLPEASLHATLTDTVRYREAMALGWMLAIEEQINLAGAAAGQRTVLAVLADVLHATGSVNVTYDARTVMTSIIALDTMIAGGWKMEAVDSIAFQDALAAQLTAVATLVDTASFADTPSPSLRLLALCADEVDFGDDGLPSVDAFERLADEVLFYGVIRLGDAEFVGWVLNNGAASEYRNYPFNGMIGFDGTYLGTADSGLYEMVGTDDAGTPIEWAIRTALMDFGTGKLKRVPDCYIAFAGTNTVVLKVITEDAGELREDIYTATVPPGTALHNGRVKIGRGLSARYWQFELSGSGPFELDELAWRPLILDRRL